ncbi:MAG: UDP-N-acetylmuramoyl-L-alanine--D-glutamate ligase [Lachnospiraceae bacterium]|nr:UDP-N-acetylmuramoyl-L-alanine--D-glutamate ligase [Lachnospiraceae bacterium]
MAKAIVLGAGISGIAASKLLIKNDIEVLLFDNNPKISVDKIKKSIYGKVKIKILLEKVSDEDIHDVNLCVISPGFPKTNSVYLKVLKKKIPIISELELGYLYGKGEVCAITGSNGKTTTTELTGCIMRKKYGESVNVVGNVGIPYCEKVFANEDKEMEYVIECSSFQLEDIVKFKPKVAAILNFSPDHLDRYDNYTDYINAKLNIAINMDDKDVLVINYEDQILRDLALQKNLFKCKVIFFSSKRTLTEGFYLYDDAIFYKDKTKTIKLVNVDELKLFGNHNYENVMASMAIGYYMGVSFVDIVDACKEFSGLEHRIEFVREKNGVKYFNDSKATNPDAAIKAIDAMKGKILLIAGGRDKGIDYGDFIMKVKEKVRYMILIGEAKKKIAVKARSLNYNSLIFADTLDEAVDIANSYSNVGDNVLLSPACSSFDMFKSYEDRGEKFKEKVMSIK